MNYRILSGDQISFYLAKTDANYVRMGRFFTRIGELFRATDPPCVSVN